MKEVIAKSYTLYDENGNWLGQVVLTSDGMFASVTDWGDFSYAWRHFGEDFNQFILGLSVDYFGGKMYQGMSYITATKTVREACQRYAEKILPVLQAELRK